MKEKTKVQSREKDQYDGEEPGVEEYLADLLDKSLTEQERKNVEDTSDENILFYILLKKYWYLLISALLIVALIFLYLFQINPGSSKQFINQSFESGIEKAKKLSVISLDNDQLHDSDKVDLGN